MDLQMPGIDGIEATRLIRSLADPAKCRIPILAVTANNSRATRRMCLAAGMDDCLVKPFKEEVLFRKIASLVGSQRTRQSYRPARRIPSVKGGDGVLRHPLYDLTKIQSGTAMNPEFLKRMLGIFNETVPPAVDEMLERHRMGDLISVSALAHKIRPTLDGSGISILKETIRNIEHHLDRNRTPEQLNDDLNKLYEVIQTVSRQFVSELERMAEPG
jgi:CheY-like chemotaxis protein